MRRGKRISAVLVVLGVILLVFCAIVPKAAQTNTSPEPFSHPGLDDGNNDSGLVYESTGDTHRDALQSELEYEVVSSVEYGDSSCAGTTMGHSVEDSIDTTVVSCAQWSAKQAKIDAISKLQSAKTGNAALDEEISEAIDLIQKSLQDSLWIDQDHIKSHSTDTSSRDSTAQTFAARNLISSMWGTMNHHHARPGIMPLEILFLTNLYDTLSRNEKLDAESVFEYERAAVEEIQENIAELSRAITELHDVIAWNEECGQDTSSENIQLDALQTAEYALHEAINDLVRADKILATTALNDSENLLDCGLPEWKEWIISNYIATAHEQLEKACKAAEEDDPQSAIDGFENAWRYAQQALEFGT